MKNTRKNIIIWFTKDGFVFFIEGLPSLLTFAFTPDTVKYLDVLDEIKFLAQLEAFLVQNKIDSVAAYFIVDQNASIENYFVKNNEKVLTDFLENIPYEDVISKISEKGDSMHAIGFNGAFYQLLNSALDKHNSLIEAVLPYILMPETKLTLQNGLTILKKATSLRTESMVTRSSAPQSENSTPLLVTAQKDASQSKSTLPYLIPVFVILVGVLIYLIVTSY